LTLTGVGNIRYPGGTAGNDWDWKIGRGERHKGYAYVPAQVKPGDTPARRRSAAPEAKIAGERRTVGFQSAVHYPKKWGVERRGDAATRRGQIEIEIGIAIGIGFDLDTDTDCDTDSDSDGSAFLWGGLSRRVVGNGQGSGPGPALWRPCRG
jgi:hypothetical protein